MLKLGVTGCYCNVHSQLSIDNHEKFDTTCCTFENDTCSRLGVSIHLQGMGAKFYTHPNESGAIVKNSERIRQVRTNHCAAFFRNLN